MKIRRRARPHHGVETPREAQVRERIEEAKRRSTCVAWRDDEGYEHNYHEPKGDGGGARTFTWDPKLRRSVSPVECAHCGRKGVLTILEVGDYWDDPLVAENKAAS